MSTLIKICGITSVEDARLAIQAGADWIGLIFVPGTPRCLSLERASVIVEAVGPNAKTVGVFQNPDETLLHSILAELPLDYVQLHGQETPVQCQQIDRPVIKTILTVENPMDNSLAAYAAANVQYFLLDRPKNRLPDAPLNQPLQETVQTLQKHCPMFLAGGVTPETVTDLLAQYAPRGIDVASGVEFAPGKKDPEKMDQLCRAIRRFDQQKGSIECNR